MHRHPLTTLTWLSLAAALPACGLGDASADAPLQALEAPTALAAPGASAVAQQLPTTPPLVCGTASILVQGQPSASVGVVIQTSTTPGWDALEAVPVTLDGGPLATVEVDPGVALLDATGNPVDPATLSLPADVSVRVTGTDGGEVRVIEPPLADGTLCDGETLDVQAVDGRGLTGRALAGRPFFAPLKVVDTLNDAAVYVDTNLFPHLQGRTVDVVVVASRTQAEWLADPTLTPLASQPLTLTGTLVGDATMVDLSGLASDGLGTALDVVIDVDGDGTLSAGDLLDGQGLAPSVHLVGDLGAAGPFAINVQDVTPPGSQNDKRIFWPVALQDPGAEPAPLVVISHGNGHNYTWYDHLGENLASWGFVVMSHQNNTVPGVISASNTTRTNLDELLANQGTILGGVLDGKIDSSHIGLIGHSRGGEGVVLAYDRVLNGIVTANEWSPSDIKVIQSIAPTVFEGTDADPGDVPFHLIYGAADGDVNGSASCDLCQSFRIAGYGQGMVATTYLHGASHNVFHTSGFFDDGQGPNRLSKAETHATQVPTTLAMMAWHLTDRPWLEALFARNNEVFPIPGAPTAGTVASTYKAAPASGDIIVEDVESNPNPLVASSGASIMTINLGRGEVLMDDQNNNFTASSADGANGLTWVDNNDNDFNALRLAYSGNAVFTVDLDPSQTDVSGYSALHLTMGQMTRAPETVANAGPLSLQVMLVDANGETSRVSTAPFGAITSPYPRSGSGSGVGWATEMNTVRIPLDAFRSTAVGGRDLDLSNLDKIRLLFGPTFGSDQGRVFLDDLLFSVE